jgi:anti-sigma B factor antagonist
MMLDGQTDRLEVSSEPGTVRLIGELDMSNVARADEAFAAIATDHAGIVVDVSELTFMDSQGLRVLFQVAKRIPDGSTLTIRGAHGIVLRILTIAGLDQHGRIKIERDDHG